MNAKLIKLYNKIYYSYLNGIEPEIFFTQLVNKLKDILNIDTDIELYIKNDDYKLITPANVVKTYIVELPILFNNKINGLLIIDTNDANNKELINITKEFRCMLGVLINNMSIKINKNKNETNASNNNFIAYVSHELRNPLQVINTGIYMCKKLFTDIEYYNYNYNCNSPKSDSDNMSSSTSDNDDTNNTNNINTMHQTLKKVNSACNNMNIIIDDILDITKINNNELNLNIECHELKEIIDCIHEEFYYIAENKGLEFKYIINEKCPKFINTDNTRLYQILSNLISNSIKYSKWGKIELKININDNKLVFSVIDNGRGIKEEELNKLFKEFGRTTESMNDINSTGLGLCISNKLAELLGGKITVCSEYNKGSTFSLYHPI